jgi:hypothetical protein
MEIEPQIVAFIKLEGDRYVLRTGEIVWEFGGETVGYKILTAAKSEHFIDSAMVLHLPEYVMENVRYKFRIDRAICETIEISSRSWENAWTEDEYGYHREVIRGEDGRIESIRTVVPDMPPQTDSISYPSFNPQEQRGHFEGGWQSYPSLSWMSSTGAS